MSEHNFTVAVGVCFGRGGSFFLHSLLDGHPEVLSLPPYMMNLSMQLFDTLALDNDAFVTAFLKDYQNLFVDSYDKCTNSQYINTHNNMSRTQTELLNLNKGIFKDRMLGELGNKHHCFKSRFVGVHKVIYDMLGIDTSNKSVIFYQLHSPLYSVLRKMHDEFGQIKICHSVRDPIAAFLRNVMAHCTDLKSQRKYNPATATLIMESCFRQFLYSGLELDECTKAYSLAIKLESLHGIPSKTMKGVADFLQIGWNECLLQETVNYGKSWQGIIGDTTGFDLEKTLNNNKKYKSLISQYDLYRLETIASKRLEKWGYKKESHDSSSFSSVNFTDPYTFELYPYYEYSECQSHLATHDAVQYRGRLFQSMLDVINYHPRLYAPYCQAI